MRVFELISKGAFIMIIVLKNDQAKAAIEELKQHFGRTIPLRVDTLNNKSVNPRGCFAL